MYIKTNKETKNKYEIKSNASKKYHKTPEGTISEVQIPRAVDEAAVRVDPEVALRVDGLQLRGDGVLEEGVGQPGQVRREDVDVTDS